MSGFFALLDDIATLAKLTMSTLDDTAGMAVRTSAKVSAAAVDDVATTPQYVTGISSEREIPIIKRITLGSLRNKLLVILPVALLLNALAPRVLPVALLIGGLYLCFEGGEKIVETLHPQGHQGVATPHTPDEDTVVRNATRTDFVLSTELMLLALADVQDQSSLRRVVVLVLIAFLITFAVYGLVGALIKLDDLGIRLAEPGRSRLSRAVGRRIVTTAPRVFTVIGVVGTVAMLWVGGHILAVNLAMVGVTTLHHAIEWAEEITHNPVLSWICGTMMSCLIGTVVGLVLAGGAHLARRTIGR